MGRNLLTYPYTATSTSVAVNGVTWTINEDGSIILNGTSTATVNIFFRPINAFMLPAGRYRMSNGNPDAKGYMLIGAEQSEWTGQITGNTEFEKTVYGTVGYCLYQILKGNTFNNVTIYPSLECIMTTSEMLVEVAEGTQKVFDAGYSQGYESGEYFGHFSGYSEGVNKGIEVGKSQQYDEFWDAFQQNGSRTYYSHAFRSSEWTEKILKPKYPMQPAYAAYMFYSCLYSGDLTDNVQLDFSKCTNFSYIFTYASLITHVGEMDTRSATELIAAFQNASGLITIDKIKLKDDGSQVVTNMFGGCSSLQNVVFEGKFGNNISFSDSTKLSKASIISVIKALHPEMTAKLTLSETAVNSIDWTGTVIDGVTYNTFDEVVDTKSDWTIALA